MYMYIYTYTHKEEKSICRCTLLIFYMYNVYKYTYSGFRRAPCLNTRSKAFKTSVLSDGLPITLFRSLHWTTWPVNFTVTYIYICTHIWNITTKPMQVVKTSLVLRHWIFSLTLVYYFWMIISPSNVLQWPTSETQQPWQPPTQQSAWVEISPLIQKHLW